MVAPAIILDVSKGWTNSVTADVFFVDAVVYIGRPEAGTGDISTGVPNVY